MPITTPGKFALAAAVVATLGVVAWQLRPRSGGATGANAGPSVALDQINAGGAKNDEAERAAQNVAFVQVEQLSNAAIESDSDDVLWKDLTKEQMLERAELFETLAALREATGQAHAGRLRMQAAMLLIRAGGDLGKAEELLMQALADRTSVADVFRASQAVRRLARAYREAGEDEKATSVMAQAREAVVSAVETFASSKMWRDEPAAFAQLANAARGSIFRSMGPGGGGGGWRGREGGGGAGGGMMFAGRGGMPQLDPNSEAGQAWARLRDATMSVADESTQPELASLRVEANMLRAREASQAGDYELTKAFLERASSDRTPEMANNPVVQLQDLSLLAPGMATGEVSAAALAAYQRASSGDNPMTHGISGMMTLNILREANEGTTQARVARDFVAWLDQQAANPAQAGQFFAQNGQGQGGQGRAGMVFDIFGGGGGGGGAGGPGAGGGNFDPTAMVQGMINRQRERALASLVPRENASQPSTVPVADQLWALDQLIAGARDDEQAARWQARRDALVPGASGQSSSNNDDK